MKARAGEGVGMRQSWQGPVLRCWQLGCASDCSTSPRVPGEESAAASFQPVPTPCLADPAAIGWHLPHLSTLFSGRSSARSGLWLCPPPPSLVPISAHCTEGLFPLVTRDLSKVSPPISLLCSPHLQPHMKSGRFLLLFASHKPQSGLPGHSSS